MSKNWKDKTSQAEDETEDFLEDRTEKQKDQKRLKKQRDLLLKASRKWKENNRCNR